MPDTTPVPKSPHSNWPPEARLWESSEEGKVRCLLCPRHCLIPEGGRGFCKVRINQGKRLYTLSYGNLSAIESRPIEIKPFFHYHPGSSSLTFSTWSCNLICCWCQNWRLSAAEPPESLPEILSPEDILEMALRARDEGICVSFNEPTLLFEFCLDLFPLAKKQGLYCCFVSNGFMTLRALDELIDAGLDGMNVDIKGKDEVYKRYCGDSSVEPVWEVAAHAKERGVHVEVVCLLVTGVSDDEGTVKWIVERHLELLGPDVPIHFNRYFPAKGFIAPPTLVSNLVRAREIALQSGIKFVYLGNLHGHPAENTYCPSCGAELIGRRGFATLSVNLTEDNRCPKCGGKIPLVGRARRTSLRFF